MGLMRALLWAAPASAGGGGGDDDHAGDDHDGQEHHGRSDFGLGTLALAVCVGLLIRTTLTPLTKLPYTVVLLICGLMLGLAHAEYGDDWQDSTLNHSLNMWSHISPEVLLFTMLPVLIFESSFSTDFHVFLREIWQVLALAGPGVLLATFLTALCPLYCTDYDWDWNTAMMVGAMLSATDPVAVVAILKDLGVSERLAVLIEGESLLNDGTSIVLFTVFLDEATGQGDGATGALVTAVRLAFGGPTVGILVGAIAAYLIGFVYNDPIAEISITLVACYGAFLLAEATPLHVSGVLAVVLAGLWMSFYGKGRISAITEHSLHSFWEMAGFLANTIIFFVSGLIMGATFIEGSHIRGKDWGYLFLLYAWITVVRCLNVTIWYPVLRSGPYAVDWRQSMVLAYAGLRGAVGLALALIVEESDLDEATRARVLFHMAGIALLTLLVNATTTQSLLHFLELDRSTQAENDIYIHACSAIEAKLEEVVDTLKMDRFLGDADWHTVWRYIPVRTSKAYWRRLRLGHVHLCRAETEDILSDFAVVADVDELRARRDSNFNTSRRKTRAGSKAAGGTQLLTSAEHHAAHHNHHHQHHGNGTGDDNENGDDNPLDDVSSSDDDLTRGQSMWHWLRNAFERCASHFTDRVATVTYKNVPRRLRHVWREYHKTFQMDTHDQESQEILKLHRAGVSHGINMFEHTPGWEAAGHRNPDHHIDDHHHDDHHHSKIEHSAEKRLRELKCRETPSTGKHEKGHEPHSSKTDTKTDEHRRPRSARSSAGNVTMEDLESEFHMAGGEDLDAVDDSISRSRRESQESSMRSQDDADSLFRSGTGMPSDKHLHHSARDAHYKLVTHPETKASLSDDERKEVSHRDKKVKRVNEVAVTVENAKDFRRLIHKLGGSRANQRFGRCSIGSLVVEGRVRLLTAVKAAYHSHFERGWLTAAGLRILVENVDQQLDQSHEPLSEWRALHDSYRVPDSVMNAASAWRTVPVVGMCSESFLFKRLSFVFELASNFIEAHEEVDVHELIEDGRVAATLITEQNHQTELARNTLSSQLPVFPEIARALKTQVAARFLLVKHREFTAHMMHNGFITGKEYDGLVHANNDMVVKLAAHPRAEHLPPRNELLHAVPFLRYLTDEERKEIVEDETICTEEFHGSNVVLIEKDGSAVAAGPSAGRGGWYVVVRGSIFVTTDRPSADGENSPPPPAAEEDPENASVPHVVGAGSVFGLEAQLRNHEYKHSYRTASFCHCFFFDRANMLRAAKHHPCLRRSLWFTVAISLVHNMPGFRDMSTKVLLQVFRDADFIEVIGGTSSSQSQLPAQGGRRSLGAGSRTGGIAGEWMRKSRRVLQGGMQRGKRSFMWRNHNRSGDGGNGGEGAPERGAHLRRNSEPEAVAQHLRMPAAFPIASSYSADDAEQPLPSPQQSTQLARLGMHTADLTATPIVEADDEEAGVDSDDQRQAGDRGNSTEIEGDEKDSDNPIKRRFRAVSSPPEPLSAVEEDSEMVDTQIPSLDAAGMGGSLGGVPPERKLGKAESTSVLAEDAAERAEVEHELRAQQLAVPDRPALTRAVSSLSHMHASVLRVQSSVILEEGTQALLVHGRALPRISKRTSNGSAAGDSEAFLGAEAPSIIRGVNGELFFEPGSKLFIIPMTMLARSASAHAVLMSSLQALSLHTGVRQLPMMRRVLHRETAMMTHVAGETHIERAKRRRAEQYRRLRARSRRRKSSNERTMSFRPREDANGLTRVEEGEDSDSSGYRDSTDSASEPGERHNSDVISTKRASGRTHRPDPPANPPANIAASPPSSGIELTRQGQVSAAPGRTDSTELAVVPDDSLPARMVG